MPHNQLAVYIHLPWCIKKCPYCDFNSHTSPETIPAAEYLKALFEDWESSKHIWQRRELTSIFFGGGTPSLFPADVIAKLITRISQDMAIDSSKIEITMEANPGTFEQDKFAAFRCAGINRLSLGVQSFNDQHLQLLGRIHNADNARSALEKSHQVGFDNINIDLMFGLPQQSPSQAYADLDEAIAFNPNHISWYQLTIEPNTMFARFPPQCPNHDQLADVHANGLKQLVAAGYKHYEVSAFAKPNQFCRHNLSYWRYRDYLGIGAGAHSKWTDASGIIWRAIRNKHPARYLQFDPQASVSLNSLSVDQDATNICFEYFLNHLRLSEAIDYQDFEKYTGLASSHIEPLVEELIAKKLALKNSTGFCLTKFGKLFLNDVQGMFLQKVV